MKRTATLAGIIGPRAAKKLPDSITDIIRLSTEDMIARGITPRDAIRIRSAITLAAQISEPAETYRIRITGPATAMQYCLTTFANLAKHGVQEEFHVVTLDTKNQPIATHLVTVGTLRNSLVHPREVFRPAISDAANCILVVHNHPSGDPTPSDQDISITERLEAAAEIIGIPVVDHIVVAGDKALSIQEFRSGNRW